MKHRRCMGMVKRLILHPANILITGLVAAIVPGQPSLSADLEPSASNQREIQPVQQTRPVQPHQPTVQKTRRPAPVVPVAVPMIRNASPVRSLERGGASQTMTLSGTDLHLITSVKIVRNGVAAPGISARLGPAAESSRQLTLTAQPEALPGEYELLFLASGKRVEISTGSLMSEFMKLSVVIPFDDPESQNTLLDATREVREAGKGEGDPDTEEEP